MKHSWAFALLLGGIIGAFAVIVSTDPLTEAPDPAAPALPTQVAAPTRGTDEAASTAQPLDPGLDDEALAQALEQAQFARDWARVEAVVTVLRSRARTGEVASDRPVAPPRVFSGPSLVRLDHEYRRATFERELEVRVNAATRAAMVPQTGSTAPIAPLPEEVERREALLRALFLAPPVRLEDDLVRSDAAHLLARLKTQAGRRTLVEALEGPDVELSALAAVALARSGDPQAIDGLVALLQSDRDPALRARVADALVHLPDLVGPGSPVTDALARAALDDRELEVRTHALAALARADLGAQPASREVLVQLITDEKHEAAAREAAVGALRKHHAIARVLPPDLIAALILGLDRTTGALRLEVIAALGEAAGEVNLPKLEAAVLATADPNERAALVEAVDAVRRRAPPP